MPLTKSAFPYRTRTHKKLSRTAVTGHPHESPSECYDRADRPRVGVTIVNVGHHVRIGHIVLFLLVGIHWILPFTPVNPHDELRIVVASMVLGASFLALAIRSFTQPIGSFAGGGALLTVVIAVSALTGGVAREGGGRREGVDARGPGLGGVQGGDAREADDVKVTRQR